MALWIESHVELHGHIKTARLKRALGVGRPQAVGHLHCLWWWAAQHAETGDLSGMTACDISDAAEWEGDPEVFLSAMVAAGFIDQEPLSLHGWQEYFGKLLASKQASRERAQRGRERAAKASDSGTVRESTRTVREPYADSSVPYTGSSVPYTVDLDLNLDLNQYQNQDQDRTPTPNDGTPSFVGSLIPEETDETTTHKTDSDAEQKPRRSTTRRQQAPRVFVEPTEQECIDYGRSIGLSELVCMKFYATMVRDGWTTGKQQKQIVSWKGAMNTWKVNEKLYGQQSVAQQSAVAQPYKPTKWKSELEEATGEHWTA